MEDARGRGEVALHAEPVPEVIPHVVAAEGKHGHGIAADVTDGSFGGCGGFRTHGGSDVDAGGPVECLEDERHGGGAATAEDECGDEDAVRIFPGGVNGGALRGGCGEAAVGVGCGGCGLRCPVIAAPVECFGGGRVGHALPPDASVGNAIFRGECDVGEDGVGAEGGHGVGVGLVAGAGGDAEEAGFGIDGAELDGAVGLGLARKDPCDIVADGPDLPAIEAGRGDEHGEVGFAAGRGEGCGDVGLFGFAVGVIRTRKNGRGFDADDEHVFGHPALVAGDVGGDAESEAFFSEECVSTIAGAVGPDLAGLGKVDDVLFFVAGPGNVLLSWCERGADRVETGNDAFLVFVDLGINGCADAGHDAHVSDGVGAIGELDADLRHRGADGAHGEGHDVHGATAHAAAEEGLELTAHAVRIFPVVGGPGVVFGERADESAVFDACDVVGGGASVEAAGPFCFGEPGEGACVDECVAEAGVLFLRAVEPVDGLRLTELGHLFDPADEVFVGGGRGGGAGMGVKMDLGGELGGHVG